MVASKSRSRWRREWIGSQRCSKDAIPVGFTEGSMHDQCTLSEAGCRENMKEGAPDSCSFGSRWHHDRNLSGYVQCENSRKVNTLEITHHCAPKRTTKNHQQAKKREGQWRPGSSEQVRRQNVQQGEQPVHLRQRHRGRKLLRDQ